MGLVSANRLNRFWQKGVKPIKDAIGVLSTLSTVDKSTLVAAINELATGKFDVAKIVASTNITEPGFAMDGKTASEALAELYSNLEYSFEERSIGTWVDGKPLYRKMIDFGELPSNSLKNVTYDIENVEHIHIDIGKSFWYAKTHAIAGMGASSTFVYSNYITIVSVASGNRIIIGTNNVAASDYKALICLEYTKTTD